MNDREKLINMIQDAVGGCARRWAEIIADYLLENGVIVPPCKVGDKLYYIAYRFKDKAEKYIREETIEEIKVDKFGMYVNLPKALTVNLADLGERIFLSYEEAEKALKGAKDINVPIKEVE